MTQPEYWAAITRAAFPRTAAAERAALAELALLDTLDVLKWSDNLGGVGAGAFEFGDWRRSLSFLADSAAGMDLDAVQRIGHVPSNAPAPAHEITEEQYWDGVRQVLDYTLRHLAQYTYDAEDLRDALASELWHRIHGHAQQNQSHPHTNWPRSLDVLRYTQNLDATLLLPGSTSRTVDTARGELTYDWLQTDRFGRMGAIETLAELAMWSDALRMGTSSGKYMPNVRPNAYWDAVRQMTVRTHYPVDYEKDMPLSAAFIVDFQDALDAMRLSSEPGMIGAWLHNVMAPKRSDEPLQGALPPEPNTRARDLTVTELVIAAGRVAALADTDWWASQKKPYPSRAPQLMSLDQYIAYVQQAATLVARSADPVKTYLALLDAGGTSTTHASAHPLISLPQDGTFPYRTLDVLEHTAHPEAIWENAGRRVVFERGTRGPWTQPASYDRTKAQFNAAGSGTHSETAFAWLASAAFGADILDELSVMGLSKYAPNAVG